MNSRLLNSSNIQLFINTPYVILGYAVVHLPKNVPFIATVAVPDAKRHALYVKPVVVTDETLIEKQASWVVTQTPLSFNSAKRVDSGKVSVMDGEFVQA